MFATPSPVPGPVAKKLAPTVFEGDPIKVKSVLPTSAIVYLVPLIKDPATTDVCVIESSRYFSAFALTVAVFR